MFECIVYSIMHVHCILCTIDIMHNDFHVPQPLGGETSTNGLSDCVSVYLSVTISEHVIGQTAQKLVSHWLRLGALFRKRIMFWGVGGKCYI